MPGQPVRDEFSSITERSPLVEELRARIERDGPMTFRDFMESALYHPRHGYYRGDAAVTSRGGDYVTSPEVHPIFGTLVAKQIIEMWDVMSRPSRFDIVEAGAGRGLLARDILLRADADPAFAAALRYSIVEPVTRLREAQRATLADAGVDPEGVEWLDALPDRIEGVVLSNELLDAFPLHRVTVRDGVLHEVYVTHDGTSFHDTIDDVSDPAIGAYFEALELRPGEGCIAEVNLEAPRWIASVAGALERGYVLTFDYGYEARDLYAPWRRDGTLLCFYRQSANSDPYQRVGRQDITASVDFTTLRAAGETAGLRTIAMTDQADFLVRMGIGEGVAAVGTEHPARLEEYFARRNVVLDLIDPAKLGRVKALLQGKGVPGARLRGFADA